MPYRIASSHSILLKDSFAISLDLIERPTCRLSRSLIIIRTSSRVLRLGCSFGWLVFAGRGGHVVSLRKVAFSPGAPQFSIARQSIHTSLSCDNVVSARLVRATIDSRHDSHTGHSMVFRLSLIYFSSREIKTNRDATRYGPKELALEGREYILFFGLSEVFKMGTFRWTPYARVNNYLLATIN